MHLSIVIPCFNEQKNLDKNIPIIINYFENIKLKYEILIIDDFSINKLSYHHKKVHLYRNDKNYGKGYSVKKGIKKSLGDWILFTDSDLSVSIDQFDKLMNFTNNYDLICASRGLPDSNIVIKQNLIRSTLGKLFNLLIKIIRLSNFTDTQCGFKLMNKNKINLFLDKLTINRFSFDVDLLTASNIHKLRIIEVPIVWRNYTNSKVNILIDPLIMFNEILIILIKKINLKY